MDLEKGKIKFADKKQEDSYKHLATSTHPEDKRL